MPFDANEYRAVVNPTNVVQQTWGYGRRLVLVPGELQNPSRAPVQFVKTRIARKAVKNRRRFLQLMTVEQGMRLINLARELDNFPAAYKQLTGRTAGTSAGEIMQERELKQKLRRTLINSVGVEAEAMDNWTVADMRAVIKDNTLLADIDEVTGRPRYTDANTEQGSLFEAMDRAATAKPDDFTEALFHKEKRLPSSEDRVGERGNKGDFFVPEEISDNEPTVEEVAAKATAEYDAESGGVVKGEGPKGYAGGFKMGEVTPLDTKDLEEPLPEPEAAPEAPRGESLSELRKQIEDLGGKWHPASKVERLTRDRDALIAQSINDGNE
jgi:molybdopterin converting factor small subunit